MSALKWDTYTVERKLKECRKDVRLVSGNLPQKRRKDVRSASGGSPQDVRSASGGSPRVRSQ